MKKIIRLMNSKNFQLIDALHNMGTELDEINMTLEFYNNKSNIFARFFYSTYYGNEFVAYTKCFDVKIHTSNLDILIHGNKEIKRYINENF